LWLTHHAVSGRESPRAKALPTTYSIMAMQGGVERCPNLVMPLFH